MGLLNGAGLFGILFVDGGLLNGTGIRPGGKLLGFGGTPGCGM